MLKSAFRSIDDSVLEGLSMKNKASLGLHNSLLQVANSSYSTSAFTGAGIGAGVGAIDGALSYDGSFFGGAFSGALKGAAGGVGLKFSADTYARGASLGFKPFEKATSNWSTAIEKDGVYSNAWSKGGSKVGNKGESLGAFQWGAFGRGWSGD